MTARTHLRPAAGWVARRGRELLESAAERRPGDLPPRRLRARAGAPGIEEFSAGGATAAAELAGALGPRGFVPYPRILDFGCGAARVLPHVSEIAQSTATLAGADVDAEAIRWATKHHPTLDLRATAALPPLPWASRSFDCIYSISVFSHLTEADQDAWLAELARLLAHGGVALLSTHGQHAFEAFRRGEVSTSWCAPEAFDRGPLGRQEMVSIPYRVDRWSRGDLRGTGEGYGLTFHASGYIAAHWSRWLTVERVLPAAVTGWQDLVVCRSQSAG